MPNPVERDQEINDNDYAMATATARSEINWDKNLRRCFDETHGESHKETERKEWREREGEERPFSANQRYLVNQYAYVTWHQRMKDGIFSTWSLH